MKKIALLLGSLMLIASFISVADANHAWGKYHWNISTEQSLANPLLLGNNLSLIWQTSLSGASADWNESVLKNQISSGASNANCDPTLGNVEVCNGTYGENGWLGIAQVWAYRGKDGHIAQGIVKLNDTYFSQPAYNSSAWRNLVMCQEIGHTFGLDHQDENFDNANLGTCMDYTSDPSGSVLNQLNNEHPNDHDYEMMSSIYGHLNGISDGPGGGKGKVGKGKLAGKQDIGGKTFNDAAEWGQAIKQDALGRNSLYVRNLGNGVEVITHVLWAK